MNNKLPLHTTLDVFRWITNMLVLVGALCAANSTDAHAWGIEGHKAIALMAERHLRTDVATHVKALLTSEGAKSLTEVANWADTVNTRETNGPRHTTRLPLDFSEDNFEIVCKKRNICATWGIKYQADILSDQKKSTDERLSALKYVVHLVGDTHQPMHASVRVGNELVMVGHRRSTAHKIWDTLIVRQINSSIDGIVREMEAWTVGMKTDVSGTPESWAIESRDMARDQIFPELDASRNPISGIIELSSAYLENHRTTVVSRLAQASLRLAALLNKTLSAPKLQ